MGSSVTAAMASSVSADFFENGTNKQFEWVLSKYQEALQAKADGKPGKAEALLKLDKWYQNDLPKKIKSRGKDGHLTHEELVQTIKWKLARGKFYPQLTNLVRINTPRAVQAESRKAFRKLPNLDAAITTLCGLKGVGCTLASAVLAAGCPELAPFMADECLLSMEGTEGIDYTMKEYMKLVAKTQQCVERLNEQGGDWTPHKVEMAVWTHYVARDLKPELLDDMPSKHENKVDRFNGDSNSMTGVAVNGEAAAVKNGDHDRVKMTQETVEPVATAAATVSATTKRPLEDAAEVETLTPDMKRARESLETKEVAVEEPTEVNRPDSSSSTIPVSPPSMGSSSTQEVAPPVVTNPQPIHTGGD